MGDTIDSTVKTPNNGDFESSVGFSDIADNLDFGILGHVEGQGDNFGFFGDLIYLSLGKNANSSTAKLDFGLDSTITELAMVYSPGVERYQGWELIAGMRNFDMSVKVDESPFDPLQIARSERVSTNATDVMLGARYTFKASEKWGITLRGDYSAGGTNGTWNASAIAQYHVSRGAWGFGYRYMNTSLSEGNTDLDMTLSGPEVGYSFTF